MAEGWDVGGGGGLWVDARDALENADVVLPTAEAFEEGDVTEPGDGAGGVALVYRSFIQDDIVAEAAARGVGRAEDGQNTVGDGVGRGAVEGGEVADEIASDGLDLRRIDEGLTRVGECRLTRQRGVVEQDEGDEDGAVREVADGALDADGGEGVGVLPGLPAGVEVGRDRGPGKERHAEDGGDDAV